MGSGVHTYAGYSLLSFSLHLIAYSTGTMICQFQAILKRKMQRRYTCTLFIKWKRPELELVVILTPSLLFKFSL